MLNLPKVIQALCGLLLSTFTALAFATTVKHDAWGRNSSGKPIDLYTLRDGKAEVSVTTFGARIVSIRVPDRTGKISNVVLSRENADGYTSPGFTVMGATIGRYANRIAGARFVLDGATYSLSKNNGENMIHGGSEGFDRKVWGAKPIKDGVEMSLVSPDGDMGFPGELTIHATFTLHDKDGNVSLRISYSATTTKSTVINITNHTYFNLANDSDVPVMAETAMIAADVYTPVDRSGIPTGTLESVAGSPLDFRSPRTLATGMPQRGYDNNFVLRSPGIENLAAEVDDSLTGRTLRVYTTEPGLQFFVPHSVSQPSANSSVEARRPPALQAFCLETQHFPDTPNHPEFPTTELRPRETFRSATMYVFSVSPASH